MATGIFISCAVLLIAMGFLSGIGWGWIVFGAVMLTLTVGGSLIL